MNHCQSASAFGIGSKLGSRQSRKRKTFSSPFPNKGSRLVRRRPAFGFQDIEMDFNGRKLEDQRREAVEKEAANPARDRRSSAAWNERQAKARCRCCSRRRSAPPSWRAFGSCECTARHRTINAIDSRALDRHPDAAVTGLIPALSCRLCRPNAPFAELVRLPRTSIADEMREQHRRRVPGE
jgi:hypothetical protein